MRRNQLILSVFLLSACTMQQQNGNDNDLRFQAPPLIAGNHWQTTKQFVASDGDRVCSVSAGELEVTQRAHDKTVVLQVAVSTPISPGDYYHVNYGSNAYVTLNGVNSFGPDESKAIVADLMKGGIVYTEIQQQVVRPGSQYVRIGNKINLEGFGDKFNECKRFVTSQAHG